MNCARCGKPCSIGRTLHRISPKGENGVFVCEDCLTAAIQERKAKGLVVYTADPTVFNIATDLDRKLNGRVDE
jgi:hypothetical protein